MSGRVVPHQQNLFTTLAIGVKSIKTKELYPNPHNPRVLFDRDDLDVLKKSIAQVGILVPLTVYREKQSGRYVILDGQRRWICAEEIDLANVPVNEVEEPGLVANIVTMFQIHKLRSDWELMPTALKLAILMDELKEKNEKRLAALTGLNESVVIRCKKLLSFSSRFQNLMLDADPTKRVKADFFIELYPVVTDRVVSKFPWFNRDRFTDAMLEKHAVKGIRAVTEFRIVKQYVNNAVKVKRISLLSKRMEEFASKPDLSPDHLNIASAEVGAKARMLLKTVNGLYDQVNEIDTDQFYGQEELWKRLLSLAKLIHSKMKDLERREDQ